MPEILVGLLIGLVAGVLSGLFGIGGGVVIVPALIFFGFAAREATGTSLAALLLPVGILAVIEYWRRGEIQVKYAIGIALGLLVGALFGAKVAGRVSNRTIEQLFALLLIIVAARMLLARR